MGESALREIHEFADHAASIWPDMVEAYPYLQKLCSRHPNADAASLSSELRWAFRGRGLFAADDPWGDRNNPLFLDRPLKIVT